MIRARAKHIGRSTQIAKSCDIRCETIILGNEVVIEENTIVQVLGTFAVGDLSTLGRNTVVRGNNVRIGCEFFSDGDLEVGGGGWRNPQANLVVGDRCVMHDNHINVHRPVTIGDHVGLSPEAVLLTHGYWMSPLLGYPFKEGSIRIGDNVIIGWRSLILPGVSIGRNSVIGAGAVVASNVEPYTVVGGVPAKFLKKVNESALPRRTKIKMTREFVNEYIESLVFRGIRGVRVDLDYPDVMVNGARFNVETGQSKSLKHSAVTDDFRDFMRRKGIWFYGRRFKSMGGRFE